MENYSGAVLNKKTAIVIVSVLLVLFIVIVSALYFLSSSPKTPASVPAVPSRDTVNIQTDIRLTQAPVPKPTVVPMPRFNAEKHVLQTIPPVPPQTVSLYTFKNNYSQEEVRAFGQRLGLNTITPSKENSDFYLVSQMQDINTRGYMQFNRKTGEFLYKSFGAVVPDGTQTDANPIALGTNYVKKLGLDDGTVSCTNYYSVKGYENSMVTVVCHRDWGKVGGLPIVGFPGIMNVDENTPLTSLTLGKADMNAPKDNSVVATSNGTDGKAQPEDFNSISITLEKKTGRLLAISSNLRQLVQSEPQSATSLISPLTALQMIQQNNAEFTLVSPAGQGQVNWSQVYPQNKAKVQQALIKDFVLVYLEKPSAYTQQILLPYYIIRGTAQLDTGYTTKYVSFVPALDGKTIVEAPIKSNIKTFAQGQVAGVQSTVIPAKDAAQKQGTFNTSESSTPYPTIQVDQPSGEVCIAGKGQGQDSGILLHIEGLGDVHLTYNGKHQYYIGSSTFPATDKKVIEDAFFDLVAKQYVFNSANYINRNKDNQSLKTLVNANTADSYNQLFDSVHGFYRTPGIKQSTTCESSIYPPNKDCYSQYDSNSTIYSYDHVQIGVVRDKVVNTFIAKGSNAISDLSTGTDIFPQSTLTNFSWVFLKLGTKYQTDKGDCYISGTSPSLFIYPQMQSEVQISYPSSTVYTYPSTYDQKITVMANPNGVINAKNASYEYLYYEYSQGVKLSVPQEGYIIPSRSYIKWINETLVPVVGLTASETNRLVIDVKNIMRNVKTPYIKVALASEKELNEKVPVYITSIPNLHRVHIFITPLNSSVQLTPQPLPKLDRVGWYSVEVGARLVN